MRRLEPVTGETFRTQLDQFAAHDVADLDGLMLLGRRAAAHAWAGDALAQWLEVQPASAQVVDVAAGVLFGFGVARAASPPPVVVALLERASALGAFGLRHAANNIAFIAARVLRDATQPPALRQRARELLEDLLAHADDRSLQSAARQAARDALAGAREFEP